MLMRQRYHVYMDHYREKTSSIKKICVFKYYKQLHMLSQLKHIMTEELKNFCTLTSIKGELNEK